MHKIDSKTAATLTQPNYQPTHQVSPSDSSHFLSWMPTMSTPLVNGTQVVNSGETVPEKPYWPPRSDRPSVSPPNDRITSTTEAKQHYLEYCKSLQSGSSSSSSPLLSTSNSIYNGDEESESANHLSNSGILNSKHEFLIENWLEAEFQLRFKDLNQLINLNLSKSNYYHATELFFVRQHEENANSLKNDANLCDSEKQQSQLRTLADNFANQQKTQDVAKPRHWFNSFIARNRATVSTANKTKVKEDNGILSDLSQPESTKVQNASNEMADNVLNDKSARQISKSSVKINQESQEQLSWLEERINFLRLVMFEESEKSFARWLKKSPMVFLCLTKPDEKFNRDSLLYSYPSLKHMPTNHQVKLLSQLGGMFVTLSEVVNTFTENTSTEVLNSVLVNFQLPDGNSVPHRLGFVLANVENSKTKENLPIVLTIALPALHYSQTDVQAIIEIYYQSIQTCFGTLNAAFEPLFTSNSRSRVEYLNRTLTVLNVLISTETNLTRSLLSLSNTFFTPLNSEIQTKNVLAVQPLSLDEPTALSLCNYLNDYDSLDWLDECIQFYKNGIDLEQSLSEHFARCLQSGDERDLSTNAPDGHSQSLLLPEQELFDLLELELSSFVSLGSCIFYRGLYVQSHLTASHLRAIRQLLFSLGFLASTKHGSYDLVHFAPFSSGEPNQPGKFLLVLGYGHLLQCTLFEVHSFERSCYAHVFNLSTVGEKPDIRQPSSFAFYVFIKESYRLLCLYLQRFNLMAKLNKEYDFSKRTSNAKLYATCHLNMKSKKNAYRNALFKILPNKGKKQNEAKNKEEKSAEESHESNQAQNCSCEDSTSYVSETSTRHDAESLPSLSTESYCSQNTVDIWSFASHSSTTGLLKEDEDSLPDDLVCYLLTESSQNVEIFHGPILSELDHVDNNQSSQLITSIIAEICEKMHQFRQVLHRLSRMHILRRNKSWEDKVGNESTVIKSTRRLTLNYDAKKGQLCSVTCSDSHTLVFCLLGRVSIDRHANHCGDEFYACFLINQRNDTTKHSGLKRLSSFRQRSKSFHRSSSRNEDYEIGKIDSLLVDLDELLRCVRFGNCR